MDGLASTRRKLQALRDSLLREIAIDGRDRDPLDEQLARDSRSVPCRHWTAVPSGWKTPRSLWKKIAAGTYGFCEDFEEEIGAKRLEARFEAVRCISCQTLRELTRRPDENLNEFDTH